MLRRFFGHFERKFNRPLRHVLRKISTFLSSWPTIAPLPLVLPTYLYKYGTYTRYKLMYSSKSMFLEFSLSCLMGIYWRFEAMNCHFQSLFLAELSDGMS